MIGQHYNLYSYNCAHFVADWFKLNRNIEIPIVSGFELSFAKWLVANFKEVNEPSEGCIVQMKNYDNSNHIGVYQDFGVVHNYKPTFGQGSVCHHSIDVIKRIYPSIRFYKWSK